MISRLWLPDPCAVEVRLDTVSIYIHEIDSGNNTLASDCTILLPLLVRTVKSSFLDGKISSSGRDGGS